METRTVGPVSGKLLGTFEELHAAGCIQTGADTCTSVEEARSRFGRMLLHLNVATNMNVCSGCSVWNGGSCPAYKQYHTLPMTELAERQDKIANATFAPGTTRYPGLSMVQIASELGVSKSEVRRRKVAGLL